MSKLHKATFGAGCFWQTEEVFRSLDGVKQTQVGYMGGTKDNPTYEEVCSGKTGHTEVVQIEFDPDTITYQQLLEKFWSIHDPTQINRQGNDIGWQYRSVIFYHNEDQLRWADASLRMLGMSSKYSKPIATKLEPAGTFWPAEEYHQKYLGKRGLSTCPV